ncbi:hypothetical protein DIPPA_09450 [Diplonema papillatum]|nr:hypothetical protein DIPPA_09450 [Diplonema papillatum]
MTNGLWTASATAPDIARDVAGVIAGSMSTRSHTALWSGDEGAALCLHCASGEEETLDHVWWRCGAYEAVRRNLQYEEVALCDRSTWPRCLTIHCILPRGFEGVKVELLQTMLAEICRQKRELERGDIPAERNHPWRELDHETCSAHPVDLGSIDRPEIVAAVGGERVFRAAQAWLDGMYWSTAGEVSTAELAIGFEVFTGVDLPGPLIATSLKVSLLTRTKKMLATRDHHEDGDGLAVKNLFKFLDSFEDLSLMQFSAEKKAYEPFGLNWIKSKLYSQLKADQ